MIKGIIFDFGGVLVTDPSLNISDSEAQILNVEPQFLIQVYRNENLGLFEKGLITEDKFWSDFKKEIEKHNKSKLNNDQIKQFQEKLINDFKLYFKFKKFILELKRNYKIALLTNNLPSWMPIWKKKFELKKIFPIIVTSFGEKIRKPNPEIYLRTCKKLKLEPKECLFIDDQEKNISGAKKAGMAAIRFTTEAETIKNIQKKLKE